MRTQKFKFRSMRDILPADTIRIHASLLDTVLHRSAQPSCLRKRRTQINLPCSSSSGLHGAVAVAARPTTSSDPAAEIACIGLGEDFIRRMDSTGKILQTLPIRGKPYCLKYDQSGEFLATGGESGELCVWNVTKKHLFRPEVWLVGSELGNKLIMDIAFCDTQSMFVLTYGGHVHFVRRPAKTVLPKTTTARE